MHSQRSPCLFQCLPASCSSPSAQRSPPPAAPEPRSSPTPAAYPHQPPPRDPARSDTTALGSANAWAPGPALHPTWPTHTAYCARTATPVRTVTTVVSTVGTVPRQGTKGQRFLSPPGALRSLALLPMPSMILASLKDRLGIRRLGVRPRPRAAPVAGAGLGSQPWMPLCQLAAPVCQLVGGSCQLVPMRSQLAMVYRQLAAPGRPFPAPVMSLVCWVVLGTTLCSLSG